MTSIPKDTFAPETQPRDNGSVLILTADAEFVGELVEPLEAWRAEPRWIGAGDDALAYLATLSPAARRVVLMVDGRSDVLPALSLGHRALSLLNPPPHVLFVVDEARIDSVVGLADDELDGILPAPFTLNALRSAFHALWVEPPDWFLADPSVPLDPQPPSRAPLPLAEPEPPEAPERLAELSEVRPFPAARLDRRPAVRRSRRTLVGAANPANRKIIASILRRAGHAVHLAETVDQVLHQLEAREPDILLLDLTGASGFDYDAAWRCRRARPSLRIVALTGDAPEEAERHAPEVGLDALLPKPVEPRRLLAAIEGATRGDSPDAATEPVSGSVVTELSSHPRFAGEPASAFDGQVGEVHSLPDRGRDAVELFRLDTGRIVADIARAGRLGDVAAFASAVETLAERTADLVAPRLQQTLQSMADPTPTALRLHGGEFVARVEAELQRLEAMLADPLIRGD